MIDFYTKIFITFDFVNILIVKLDIVSRFLLFVESCRIVSVQLGQVLNFLEVHFFQTICPGFWSLYQVVVWWQEVCRFHKILPYHQHVSQFYSNWDGLICHWRTVQITGTTGSTLVGFKYKQVFLQITSILINLHSWVEQITFKPM